MKKIHKKCQAVLLFSSRNSGAVTKNRHTNRISFGGSPSSADNRHLYILSDEEIKEGDWVYSKLGFGGIFKVSSIANNEIWLSDNNKLLNQCSYKNYCKKIIATTNPELGLEEVGKAGYSIDEFIPSLPKPTDQFIQDWIDKGCPEFVNVDYWIMGNLEKLAIQKDNTITCNFINDTIVIENPSSTLLVLVRKLQDEKEEDRQEILRNWDKHFPPKN